MGLEDSQIGKSNISNIDGNFLENFNKKIDNQIIQFNFKKSENPNLNIIEKDDTDMEVQLINESAFSVIVEPQFIDKKIGLDFIESTFSMFVYGDSTTAKKVSKNNNTGIGQLKKGQLSDKYKGPDTWDKGTQTLVECEKPKPNSVIEKGTQTLLEKIEKPKPNSVIGISTQTVKRITGPSVGIQVDTISKKSVDEKAKIEKVSRSQQTIKILAGPCVAIQVGGFAQGIMLAQSMQTDMLNNDIDNLIEKSELEMNMRDYNIDCLDSNGSRYNTLQDEFLNTNSPVDEFRGSQSHRSIQRAPDVTQTMLSDVFLQSFLSPDIPKAGTGVNQANNENLLYIDERHIKIINLLKRDLLKLQDDNRTLRKKYEKLIKGYKVLKNDRDMIKQEFAKKEENTTETINDLTKSLQKTQQNLAEIMSLNEWRQICNTEETKDKCLNCVVSIREQRDMKFGARSENLIKNGFFNMDETLIGSGTFSVNGLDDGSLDTPQKTPKNIQSKKKLYVANSSDNFDNYNGRATQGSNAFKKGHKESSLKFTNENEYATGDTQKPTTTAQPSYPSLKQCHGNELEYFKHKCTALIYRNEFLKIELENSKSSIEMIKDELESKQKDFGNQCKGINKRVDNTVLRHSSLLTPGLNIYEQTAKMYESNKEISNNNTLDANYFSQATPPKANISKSKQDKRLSSTTAKVVATDPKKKETASTDFKKKPVKGTTTSTGKSVKGLFGSIFSSGKK